jgi:FAD/FMN-containing dehydrogenase
MATANPVWHNWARNQHCAPASIEEPGSDAELAGLVKQAATNGQRVKVVGAGHSFTDIACTDGVLIKFDNYRRVMSIDPERATATVQAGIHLSDLNEALAARGLGMENLGDIAYQSIAGAISTGTHGTGARLRGLAAQVIGLELVTADGSILSCSAAEEPEICNACLRSTSGPSRSRCAWMRRSTTSTPSPATTITSSSIGCRTPDGR